MIQSSRSQTLIFVGTSAVALSQWRKWKSFKNPAFPKWSLVEFHHTWLQDERAIQFQNIAASVSCIWNSVQVRTSLFNLLFACHGKEKMMIKKNVYKDISEKEIEWPGGSDGNTKHTNIRHLVITSKIFALIGILYSTQRIDFAKLFRIGIENSVYAKKKKQFRIYKLSL